MEIKFTSGIVVNVDGHLEEWNIHLNPVGDVEPLWSYAIAYDKENLFVAVKVMDPALQLEAAAHGISVMINPYGKKKEGMQLLFPIPDAETIRSMLETGDFSSAHVRPSLIARSRGYKVKGFPRIVDGLLSLNNAYGLQAIAKIDSADHLVYESVIPIAQLGLREVNKPIAVQVAIQNRWEQTPKLAMRNQQSISARQNAPIRVKSPYKGKTEVWVVDQLPTK
ncbi:hypothetical protein M8998_10465 [Sphingobacterium sp. lm-10]|uniref:hypothetical protein n=1 Tax=Sphingobacterium sp. lm-10 TaxID=2944904 RepID=UPI002020FF44|nr:hypothetical protein [Sphingobacterium sp. lm-10]MCL7988361.1 hypothetical protein [Sphingobacterium sp. lm-10]